MPVTTVSRACRRARRDVVEQLRECQGIHQYLTADSLSILA